jgi:hypothetical protein
MRKSLGVLFLGLAAGCATAGTGEAPATAVGDAPKETYIPYANRDGIVEWEAVGNDILYVHALTGGWYIVRTLGGCSHLRTAVSLGFQTSVEGELDRNSAILAEGQRCPVASVTRTSGPPPRKQRS